MDFILAIYAWCTANPVLLVTSCISIASAIAKATKNTTLSKKIATVQKVVDFIAMSSTPTKHVIKELK